MNRRNPRLTSLLLARRARALRRHLTGALSGNDRGVHQSRVASRRLREALPVLTSGVKGTKAGKARKKIRKVTKALGMVRELDVTLQVLDELAAKDTLPRLALEEVRARVTSQRDERRSMMLKRLEHVNVDKLERRLTSVGQSLAEAGSDAWRDALGSRLMKRSKALAAAVTAAGHVYSPEQLHCVRIAAKKLRYAMELAADAGVKSAAVPVRALKRTQNTLGRLHDLQVLQTHVAAVQAEPQGRTVPEGGLDIISRALEDQCRHLHARYVASIPRISEIVESTRTLVVPQLAHRARSRIRPLKMTLKGRAAAAVRRPASRPLAVVGEHT
jgi:CHAD domain-containing protein